MKDLVSKLNPAFDHRNRLGIMCLLMQNDRIEYNTLKELLDMTDGNLATHLKPLEAAAFIEVNKRFVNRRTQTTYAATELGRAAFLRHLETLEEIIKHCEP